MTDFAEVAPDVYVLRYPVFDVNVTLVVGEGAALVVDTLSTPAQAAELVDAVRRVTPHPWAIVNTHHHFDHCFGNAVLSGDSGCEIWGHEEAATLLREHAAKLQREWYEEWLPSHPDLATGLAEAVVVPPNRTVHLESTVDVGGRPVSLRHFGRGHTAGDLVVHVPDADLLTGGDLIEESGPPMFGDAYPLDWPDTVAELMRLVTASTVVVPGHGAVVDLGFVHDQHADLVALAWLIRDGHADSAPVEAVAARSPFGAEASVEAVRRGYAELAGRD